MAGLVSKIPAVEEGGGAGYGPRLVSDDDILFPSVELSTMMY